LFVADFIGNPPASQLDVLLERGGVTALDSGTPLHVAAPPTLTDGVWRIAVRAESVHLVDDPAAPEATILARTSSGREWLYDLDLGARTVLRALSGNGVEHAVGETVRYRLAPGEVFFFDAMSGLRAA